MGLHINWLDAPSDVWREIPDGLSRQIIVTGKDGELDLVEVTFEVTKAGISAYSDGRLWDNGDFDRIAIINNQKLLDKIRTHIHDTTGRR